MSIPQDEKDRRREACRHANSSVSMEGGRLDQKTYEMQEKFIEGEISLQDYVSFTQAHTPDFSS